MSRRVGRPKVPKHKAKAPGISIRLTVGERRIIDSAVKRSGLKQSQWATKSLLYIAEHDIRIT
jgi:hypothetical protein